MTKFEMQKLAVLISAELMGSNKGLEWVLEKYNVPTDATCPTALLQLIDECVQHCDNCGVWFPADEVFEGVCSDCEDEKYWDCEED